MSCSSEPSLKSAAVPLLTLNLKTWGCYMQHQMLMFTQHKVNPCIGNKSYTFRHVFRLVSSMFAGRTHGAPTFWAPCLKRLITAALSTPQTALSCKPLNLSMGMPPTHCVHQLTMSRGLLQTLKFKHYCIFKHSMHTMNPYCPVLFPLVSSFYFI